MDYGAVGLKVGLEVHQQLLTERKLFCRCPAGLYTETHDGSVLRHMRPTLSELGEYDGTALMEFKTKKNIIYLLNKSNVCTYEMDDTPPFLINQNAVDVAIEQCLMLGCDIVDEVHIARKQYLDGSIPTGFQRTAIVGVNGKLPFRGRSLSVIQVSVEEDSCREVSDAGHLIVWRADRLGIPLIETVTGPDLRTPEEVEAAILLVGRVCRSTGHVRVGIGASRQDVNVSVRGGRRVEIKGVAKASYARRLVHSETVRQVNLLNLRQELADLGFKKPESIQVEGLNVTDLFARSVIPQLRRECWQEWTEANKRRAEFELGKGPFCVRAIKLIGLAGTLSWPTQPDLVFANELAGRVRVIAGLDQRPILFHSEKWPEDIGSLKELRRLKKRMRCSEQDGLVVVWGPEEDTITAEREIVLRYIDALDGVPHETRQPFATGLTEFERILPGPDRMYPDTDSQPTKITRQRVHKLSSALAEPPWQREDRYAQAGVPSATIHYLIRRGGANFVDAVDAQTEVELRRICFFFGEQLKALQRSGLAVQQVTAERWVELFTLLGKRPLLWQVWERLVRAMVAFADTSLADLVAQLGFDKAAGAWRKQLPRLLKELKKEAYDAADGHRVARFAMGRFMAEWRGRVDAKQVQQALNTELKIQS